MIARGKMQGAKIKMIAPVVRTIDTRTARPPAKTADAIYMSPAWRQLIASIIEERGRQCQQCGRTGTRIFGDHVVELKDNGAALDRRNVKLLCGSCHSIKTAAARAARMAVRY